MNKDFIPLIVAFLLLACLGAFITVLNTHDDTVSVGRKLDKSLPDIMLPTLANQNEQLDFSTINEEEFFLINIFATWCAPCKVEHAYLVRLSKQNVIPIYGINWRDDVTNMSKWLDIEGNPYRRIALDKDSKAIVALGVTGAPESFLVNSDHKIIYHVKGILTEEIFTTQIMPLIIKAGG